MLTSPILDGFSYFKAFCINLILNPLLSLFKYCPECLEITFFKAANARSL